MRVRLPAPRIGRCELQIEYTFPHDELSDEATTLVSVPLVVPGEGALTSNELTAVSQPGIEVTYPRGPWVEETSPARATNPAVLRMSARSAIPSVDLAVSITERQLDHSTTVEQAWIETRLTDTRRQDRVVFRLNTTETSLRLSLPAGAELASLEVELDGRRVGQQLDLKSDSGELILPVPDSANDEHLLEMRYFFNQRPAPGTLVLESPRLEPASWVQQLYWQLVLPATEHVFGSPPSYAREYRWHWSNLFWHREPSLNESDLEGWIGAAPTTVAAQPPDMRGPDAARQRIVNADSANRYLFSTLGAAEPLQIHTISRTRLVLLASLPLLLCGLMLIYWPATRHPATLLVAAVSVAVVGTIDPESAVLLAQAATLGLLLALAAFVMARVSVRPPVPSATPIRGSSHSLDRSFTESYQRAPSGSQPSTATNPLVPSSAPESNS
jgi:hypothetical protein